MARMELPLLPLNVVEAATLHPSLPLNVADVPIFH